MSNEAWADDNAVRSTVRARQYSRAVVHETFGSWTVDLADAVGEGGFGKVFAATGADGTRAVAKYVPKAPGSGRELLAADLPASRHIVPVLEMAESADHHVLIMPRADYSLRARIEWPEGLHLLEALDILGQVADGLEVLSKVVVHRDLKPDNILYWNGAWAVCDFGIARYAEASTAADTRKYSFTRPYAAPEQWAYQHATAATDVYAFGVVAYELIMGERPFNGPADADFYQQHFFTQAPQVVGSPALVSLVEACLTKTAQSRPSVGQVVARLASIRRAAERPRSSRLAVAQQQSTALTAQRAVEEQRRQAEAARRHALMETARRDIAVVSGILQDAIQSDAPDAQLSRGHDGAWHASLLAGTIEVKELIPFNDSSWGFGGSPPLDVIAFTEISVRQAQPYNSCSRRSHSLYYCDYLTPGQYSWFEVAFCPNMSWDDNAPFSLLPHEAFGAFGRGLGTIQIGWGARELQVHAVDDFVDRWLSWFGTSAENMLATPMALPDGPIVRPADRRR